MNNLLIAENIRSFFPEAGPFSMSIKAGERCYVQGSEKSCNALFEILTGLRKPEEGSVALLDQDLYSMSETERAAFRRDSIGAIPKGGGFLPELTLLEQVCQWYWQSYPRTKSEAVSVKRLLTICHFMTFIIPQNGVHPEPWLLLPCSVPVL